MNDLYEILSILEKDARLTAQQIADMTGKTAAEIEAMIRKAEEDGIIRRYKAVVHWDHVGEKRVYAFIDVKVTPIRGHGFDDVAERIARFPEVTSVYLVSGEYDLRVVVEGASMQEIANFVAHRLAPIDRVQSTASHFVLKRYKVDHELFGETGGDDRLAVTP